MSLLGRRVVIRAPVSLQHELRNRLEDLVAPMTGPHGTATVRTLVLVEDGRDGFQLRDTAEIVLEGIDRSTAVASILWRLNAIVAASTDQVVVHAGCVADNAGAIALPGASGSGKSWLTAALVQDGFAYLSDEHAALEPSSGLMVPVPKPLDLGTRGTVTAGSIAPTPSDALGAPVALRSIVFPCFTADMATEVTFVRPAEALLGLCGQCTNLSPLGEEAFLLLADMATRPTIRCQFGDAGDAARRIGTWVAKVPVGAPVVPAPALTAVTGSTTTVELDGELVVFDHLAGTTHLLNHAAGLVWLCASEGLDDDDIVDLVLAEAPPGALRSVEVVATIDRLRHLGLLGL